MTTYRILLPHPLEPRLLLLQTHGEWRVPQWQDGVDRDWEDVAHINRAVSARFGAETTVLRCLRHDVDPVSGGVVRIYELENHSPLPDLPPDLNWVGQQELERLSVRDPLLREVLNGWFARRAGLLPDHGAPWSRPGWYIEALSWGIGCLRDAGISTSESPEQLRASERGSLLRLRTPRGSFYLKAAADVFRHEPALARWLATRFPEHAPEVLGIDEARSWLLRRELTGGVLPLVEVREESVWEDAVRRLAELQVESAAHRDELAALGCPDRSLPVLAARVPRLLADAPAMLLGEPCGLTRSEIERAAHLGPALLALCDELAALPIPVALEPGDLRGDNVIMTRRGPVFTEWSASSLSHPFFGVCHLLRDAARMLPESSADSRRRLRDAYLEPWRERAPLAALHRAFDLAMTLAPLHHAATAHAELIPATGHRWEFACLVPRQLRVILEALTEVRA